MALDFWSSVSIFVMFSPHSSRLGSRDGGEPGWHP
jgi:hypothetical protein